MSRPSLLSLDRFIPNLHSTTAPPSAVQFPTDTNRYKHEPSGGPVSDIFGEVVGSGGSGGSGGGRKGKLVNGAILLMHERAKRSGSSRFESTAFSCDAGGDGPRSG